MSESALPPKRLTLALGVILFVAAALRFWSLGHGIPHSVGTDEPEILGRSLTMMRSGNLNPGFFDYGGFTIYFNMAIASAQFVSGAMSGRWTSLDQVWEGDFYLWSRAATACFSVMAVYIVYRVGRRWNHAVGLIGALMMAVHPNLVRESHYALTDTPLMFFVAETLLLSIVAAETGRLSWFLLAGVTTGLAAATKYNGGVAILMPLAASIAAASVSSRRWQAGLSAAAGAALAFLAAAPYSLLDANHFLNAFGSLASHFTRTMAAGEGLSTYLKHMRIAFAFGSTTHVLGWPALLLVLLGVVTLVRRAIAERARLAFVVVLLIFPAAYFWMITHQSLIFARYTLPMIPALCLGLAIGIWRAGESLAPLPALKGRPVAAVLALLIAAPPAVQAISWDITQAKVWTEEQAAQWMQSHVPKDQLIVIDDPRIRMPPGFPTQHSTRLLYESMESYRARKVAYLVTSSQQTDTYALDPKKYSSELEGWSKIYAETQIVQVIQPSKDHPGSRITILKISY